MAKKDPILELLQTITLKEYLIVTVVVFLAYAYDKWKAQNHQESKAQAGFGNSYVSNEKKQAFKHQNSRSQGSSYVFYDKKQALKQQQSRAQGVSPTFSYNDKKQSEKQQNSRGQGFGGSFSSYDQKQHAKQQNSRAQGSRGSFLSYDQKQHAKQQNSRGQGFGGSFLSYDQKPSVKQQNSRAQGLNPYIGRVPEIYLLMGTLAAPIGAGLGMVCCWHKVRKEKFTMTLLVSIVLHVYGCYRLLTEQRIA